MSHGKWGYSQGCRCTGCRLTHREQARRYRKRPDVVARERVRAEARELERLIKAQANDLRRRRYFQPPEHPQGQGRVASYTAWAYERGGGRYD